MIRLEVFEELRKHHLVSPHLKAVLLNRPGFKWTPHAAFGTALAVGKLPSSLEAVVALSAGFSYDYARRVLHGPFPLGEPAIAGSPFSYYYARKVLEGPFPLGDTDWSE